MSQYEFAWPFPAGEVFVTGTFDNWAGSVRLNKNSEGIFSAVVDLGGEVEKVLYKYIVDGNWTVDSAAQKENDYSGFENNVLYKHEIKAAAPPPPVVEEAPKQTEVAPEAVEAQTETVNILPAPEPEVSLAKEEIFMSSAAPLSSTAELAAQVPLVEEEAKAVAESPERQDVAEEVAEQTFSVSPLPASATPGNPIHLEPGEPVPEIIPQSVVDTVHLDEGSYEKADASNLGVPDAAVEHKLEEETPVTEEVTPVVPPAPAVKESVEVPIEPPTVIVEPVSLVAEPESTVKETPLEPAPENETPLLNGNAANKSPLATLPALPPTTSINTTPAEGTTFNASTKEKAASTSSTSYSSSSSTSSTHKGVSEKHDASAVLKDKIPEKKKRRSLVFNRLRNMFKPGQERGISILVSAVMCLLAASFLAGKIEWRSMLELRGRTG